METEQWRRRSEKKKENKIPTTVITFRQRMHIITFSQRNKILQHFSVREQLAEHDWISI